MEYVASDTTTVFMEMCCVLFTISFLYDIGDLWFSTDTVDVWFAFIVAFVYSYYLSITLQVTVVLFYT